jgi:tetraacyldisaccharide 4'-kinase
MKKIGQIILYPLSLLYGIAISIRNILYDTELLKETHFNIPIINVGNLSVGGAGKTPHVELLIKMLQPYINVAVLSRGYKRKTKGFRMVNRNDSAKVSGDEPVQFKRKHPQISVAVSESRALGIPQILKHSPDVQTILLDDAFQHRSVKASLNVLLTPQYELYTEDLLLPAGRLREHSGAAQRADVIIVTKCDSDLDLKQREDIKQRLKPLPHQEVFFTKYVYGNPYYIFNSTHKATLYPEIEIILISAIANTSYLLKYLNEKSKFVNSMEYEDHHIFSDRDINYLLKVYTEAPKNKTIILTTEKDAIRLQEHKQFIIDHKLPIFALPLRVEFLFDQNNTFDQYIKDFLANYKV